MMLQEEVSVYHADKIVEQVNSLQAKSVEEIEQWLELSGEPVFNSGLNIKNNSKLNTEKCLTNEPHEIFFGENSFNSDYNFNAVNGNYDNILSGLQNQKILSICEKYSNFLPDLQSEILNSLISNSNDLTLEQQSLVNTQLSSENINFKIPSLSTVKITQNINGDKTYYCHSSIANNSKDLSENFTDQSISQKLSPRFNLRRNTNSIFSSTVNEKSKLRVNFIKRKKKLSNGRDTYSTNKDSPVSSKNILVNNKSCSTKNPDDKNQSNKTLKTRILRSSTRKKNVSSFDSETNEDLSKKLTHNNLQDKIISKALAEINITENMLQFIKTKDNVRIWQCHLIDCKELFAKLCHLKHHLLAHFEIKPFKCNTGDCSSAFYTEIKLKRHQAIIHAKEKDYACSATDCKQRFSTKSNSKQHERVHKRSIKKCLALDCYAEFSTQQALDTHMRSKHDAAELANYVCNHKDCGKRFFGMSSFKSHQRTHRYSEQDITCSWPTCGKKFHQPSRLKIHMRSHTGCRPYACTFDGCKWAFTTAGKLSRHQRKHTNDRRYVCDVPDCGKNFLRPEHLKHHKLTHNQEKFGFKCDFCATIFLHKNSLCLHIKKHLNRDLGNEPTRRTKKNKTANKEKDLSSKVQPVRIAVNRLKTNSAVHKSSVTENSVQINKNIDVKPFNSFNDNILESKSLKLSSKLYLQKENIAPCTEKQNNNLTHSFMSSPLSEEELVTYSSAEQSVRNFNNPTIVVLSVNVDNCTIEPDVQNNVLQSKNTQGNSKVLLSTKPSLDDKVILQNQGSARTAFTRQYVLNSKPKNVSNSIENTNNIILENIQSSFLTKDLPFLYYQENIEVPEYQLMLFDAHHEISI